MKNNKINKKTINNINLLLNSICIIVVFLMMNYSMNELWSLKWVNKSNVIDSIFWIIGIWFVFTLIPASTSAFFPILIYCILHWKENPLKSFNRYKLSSNPPGMDFSILFSILGTYVFSLLFILVSIFSR